MQQIIDAAVALGRKVSFVGRSMVRNMGIARELGYLHVDDDDLMDIGAAEMMAPGRVVLNHHRNPGRADVGAVADVTWRASQYHADVG